jgi:ribosomal protein S12 methylthiotransferase
MRRGHNSRINRELVEKFRKIVPGITLRTTFITGYPGETEEEFRELYDFVEEMRFDRVGVFTYSHEDDTPAFGLDDDVPEEVKQRRADEIMELQEQISLRENKEKEGKVFKVLIDGKENGFWVGRTEGDSYEVDNTVLIDENEPLAAGEFFEVKITGADFFDLYATVDF